MLREAWVWGPGLGGWADPLMTDHFWSVKVDRKKLNDNVFKNRADPCSRCKTHRPHKLQGVSMREKPPDPQVCKKARLKAQLDAAQMNTGKN